MGIFSLDNFQCISMRSLKLYTVNQVMVDFCIDDFTNIAFLSTFVLYVTFYSELYTDFTALRLWADMHDISDG